MTTTFSLKQGETRSDSVPILHPLNEVEDDFLMLKFTFYEDLGSKMLDIPEVYGIEDV